MIVIFLNVPHTLNFVASIDCDLCSSSGGPSDEATPVIIGAVIAVIGLVIGAVVGVSGILIAIKMKRYI